MSSKLILVVALVSFGSGWCMSDVHRQCVATYTQDFDNDFLRGTWYHVVKFVLFGSLVPTKQCPTFVFQKPNATELQRYKDEYLTQDIPYSFEENPLEEVTEDVHKDGLVIGSKEAKFNIINPSSVFFRPLYNLKVYQRINDEYILYHDCDLRGNIMWLMSRNRNPSDAELDTIIKSRPEIVRMNRQKFCSLV